MRDSTTRSEVCKPCIFIRRSSSEVPAHMASTSSTATEIAACKMAATETLLRPSGTMMPSRKACKSGHRPVMYRAMPAHTTTVKIFSSNNIVGLTLPWWAKMRRST